MRWPVRWRLAMFCGTAIMAGAVATAASSPAAAQAEAAEIAACLCLGQSVSALGADMAAQQSAHAAIGDELARLDAQLASERARMDVNNPESVARFRQVLEQRDAAFRRSTSLASGDLNGAIERYNARANEYNARCANRPRDPGQLERVQATLSCPPLN